MTNKMEEMMEKLDALTARIDEMSHNMSDTTIEMEKLIEDINKLAKSMVAMNGSEANYWDDIKTNEGIKARIDGIENKSEKLKKKLHDMIWSVDSLAEKVHTMVEEIKQQATGRW
ncbi:MAG: hypothetical protein JRM72_08145 [Nitrososphaerota archaeon]|nr:hypothetical protein [Nitrososphaerota archaeon]